MGETKDFDEGTFRRKSASTLVIYKYIKGEKGTFYDSN